MRMLISKLEKEVSRAKKIGKLMMMCHCKEKGGILTVAELILGL